MQTTQLTYTLSVSSKHLPTSIVVRVDCFSDDFCLDTGLSCGRIRRGVVVSHFLATIKIIAQLLPNHITSHHFIKASKSSLDTLLLLSSQTAASNCEPSPPVADVVGSSSTSSLTL